MVRKKTFKVKFHFIDNVFGFLDGYYTTKEAISDVMALEHFTNADWFITRWRDEVVCINMKNVAYMEVEEVIK